MATGHSGPGRGRRWLSQDLDIALDDVINSLQAPTHMYIEFVQAVARQYRTAIEAQHLI